MREKFFFFFFFSPPTVRYLHLFLSAICVVHVLPLIPPRRRRLRLPSCEVTCGESSSMLLTTSLLTARGVMAEVAPSAASTTPRSRACVMAVGERLQRRVAVIGGGSAGVTTARFLQRAGHRPVIFEAGSTFGGVWADNPTNDVVYKNLQTNLPTVVMQSPDLDFPQGLSSYITKPQLGTYIEAYAHTFGVASLAKFDCAVKSVTPIDEEGATGEARWRVEWEESGQRRSEVFDAVTVANGHYEAPYVPDIPGQAEWLGADAASRAVVHSREYDEPEAFSGRAVLVVGGRSSGVQCRRSELATPRQPRFAPLLTSRAALARPSSRRRHRARAARRRVV
eukprot:3155303-Prymnesium_polylepis.1